MKRPKHFNEYADMTEAVPGVFYTDDGVYIVDDEGEVCCWVGTEWQDDPNVAICMANACMLAATKGAKAVRENIERKGIVLLDLIDDTAKRVNFDPSEWLFERSSGYAGMRNNETGEWLYMEEYQRFDTR